MSDDFVGERMHWPDQIDRAIALYGAPGDIRKLGFCGTLDERDAAGILSGLESQCPILANT